MIMVTSSGSFFLFLYRSFLFHDRLLNAEMSFLLVSCTKDFSIFIGSEFCWKGKVRSGSCILREEGNGMCGMNLEKYILLSGLFFF